jgi:hypothetical protein
MITILCDFRQFSAKKLAFFTKTNVMITIFAKTSSSLSKKRQFFAKFFVENIFKIVTSVAGASTYRAFCKVEKYFLKKQTD